jgi:uncharacterized protein (DUF1800 family)
MSTPGRTGRLSEAAIAANRFGLGARPGELEAIASDPRGWLKSQLTPETTPPAVMAQAPRCEDDLLAIGRFFLGQRLSGPNAAQARERLAQDGVTPAMLEDFAAVRYREAFGARYLAGVASRFTTAIASDRPVFERLALFWANHFTVSASKPQMMGLPLSFEHEVARAHACGRFEDLLRAAIQHPAMGLYLDNAMSIGPTSVWARQPRRIPRMALAGGRPTGLNENLAREVLELHTLGVTGGYTQADVRALAMMLTGWSVERPGIQALVRPASLQASGRTGAQLFRFYADGHEPGEKTLLGARYPEGVEGGLSALRALARHPSTARHIATKLVRHYVADAPPDPCVARVAQAFLDSAGDIPTVMAALIDSPEAWAEPRTKFKRPDEFYISAMRAFGVQPPAPQAILGGLERMGQRPYYAPGPNGWADGAAAWMSGDLVWKRLEWSQQAGERTARADIDIAALARGAIGPEASAATLQAIARAESPAQAATLFLMSPEFHYR